jgi:hypothetical protein
MEGLGGSQKMKFSHVLLTNTSSETTFTFTAAMASMDGFVAWSFQDEVAAQPILAVPTYDATGKLCVSIALTFTAGDEIDCFLWGV